MRDPTGLCRVASDDPAYRRQAEAEAEFWRLVHPAGLEAMDGVQDEGPIDRYINRRFTGDERVPWQDTLARRGPFRRGAFLGTSLLSLEARILETNPGLHLTFYDIAPGGLERRERVLAERFPGRVATCLADLNFVELPADTYDLVASSSTIHHVTNLEYLAWQINRSLTARGHCFVHDYVGEPRFQFDDPKRRVYLELFNRDRARRGAGPTQLDWLDATDLSPFCGVRADQTLDAFRLHLDEVERRTAAALTIPIARSRPRLDASDSPWVGEQWIDRSYWRYLKALTRIRLGGRRPSQQSLIAEEFLDELYLVGDILSDAGLLTPGLAFATYRKR